MKTTAGMNTWSTAERFTPAGSSNTAGKEFAYSGTRGPLIVDINPTDYATGYTVDWINSRTTATSPAVNVSELLCYIYNGTYNGTTMYDAIYNGTYAGTHSGTFNDSLCALPLVPTIPPPYPLLLTIVFAILGGGVSLLTVVGNLIVLLSFFLDRQIRQPSNYFIASLAVSDLFIGFSSMPLYTMYRLVGYWPLGEVMCDLWLSLDYTVNLAAQYTVFFITLDRFCSVKIPAKYRNWRTENKVITMVVITWILPALVFFVSIIGWQFFVGKRTVQADQCYVQFMDDPIYNVVLVICYYWVTLVVICVLYGGIYKTALSLHKRSAAKQKKLRTLVSMAGQAVTNIGFGVAQTITQDDMTKTEMTAVTEVTKTPVSLCASNAKPSAVRDLKAERSSSPAYPSDVETEPSSSSHDPVLTCHDSPHVNGKLNNRNTQIELLPPPTAYVNKICSPRPRHLEIRRHDDTMVSEKAKLIQSSRSPASTQVSDQDELSPVWKKRSSFESKHTNAHCTTETVISHSPDANKKKKPKPPVCKVEIKVESSPDKNSPKTITKVVSNKNKNKNGGTGKSSKSIVKRFVSTLSDKKQPNRNKDKVKSKSENRARKALKTITMILGAFVLCWTPYHVIVLIMGFCSTCVPDEVYAISYWLCYMNSPLNPFCYALANAHFKRTFKKIMRLDFRRR